MKLSIQGWTIEWDGEAETPLSSLRLIPPGLSEPTQFGAAGRPPLSGAPDALEFREKRGFFTWNEKQRSWTTEVFLHDTNSDENSVKLEGRLVGPGSVVSIPFEWTFTPLSSQEISYSIRAPEGRALRVTLASDPMDHIFGTGTQFTHVNMKGTRVPVLSQEPGIGRGVQPLSWLLNLSYGAAGTDVNSNAPSAHFLSSAGFAWTSHNTEPLFLDFRHGCCTGVETEANHVHGVLLFGETPKKLTELFTSHSGRMRALPAWVHEGAIIGLQGGSDTLTKIRQQLNESGASVTAFWLQDWVGQRKTAVGKQLWWNWERDHEHYPDWDERIAQMKQGTHPRLLSYFNPFLVDPAEKGAFQRNLVKEAERKGFLVKDETGKPCAITNTSFDAQLIDLANPETYAWFKDIIKDHLEKDSSHGWMADFGEALPMDVVIEGDTPPLTFHNQYPVEWARINREAIAEAGREEDVFFFTRSGHTKSPGQSRCFWLGDQLTSWHREDGIHSALTGLLSSGFSGFAINHSDVGGYTTTAVPGMPRWLPGVVFTRSRELLMRWTELNAFTAVFRTHEGNRPEVNHQIWDSEEALSHFSHFSNLYASLAAYRRALELEAERFGYPLVRHPWLVFPESDEALDCHDQFLLGDDLLVAPVLRKGADRRSTWLPPGQWTNVWTGACEEVPSGGIRRDELAPLGKPIVWYNTDSTWRETFALLSKLGAWQPQKG